MTHVLRVFGVTVAEAARLLGVSPSHVYRLIASDPTFPKLRKVGRASRLDPQELREWYDAQCVMRRPRVSEDRDQLRLVSQRVWRNQDS